MSTKTSVYTRIMEKEDTKITPILGHPGPENIYNLKYETARVMETEKNTLYKMGKKFGFLVIIIGETCYQVNIGGKTRALVDTDDPGPYDKTAIMAGT